ncbi:MAG TPA: hypothetical protein VJB38_03795, partial [Bacteroidota bacterium]|nr:hypothetical protein [Bacteroidota bacterium]
PPPESEPAIVKTCFNVMNTPESILFRRADYTRQPKPVQRGELVDECKRRKRLSQMKPLQLDVGGRHVFVEA